MLELMRFRVVCEELFVPLVSVVRLLPLEPPPDGASATITSKGCPTVDCASRTYPITDPVGAEEVHCTSPLVVVSTMTYCPLCRFRFQESSKRIRR